MSVLTAIIALKAVAAVLCFFYPRPKKVAALVFAPLDPSEETGLLTNEEIDNLPITRRPRFFMMRDGAEYFLSLYTGHYTRLGPKLSSASDDVTLPWNVVYPLLPTNLQKHCAKPVLTRNYVKITPAHRPVDLDLASVHC